MRITKFLALAFLLTFAVAACDTAGNATATPEPTATPPVTPSPEEVLSNARDAADDLETYSFNGHRFQNIVVTGVEDDEPYAGGAVGTWAAGQGWSAEVEGFGFGRGLTEAVVMVSDGDRVLRNDNPAEEDWAQIDSAPFTPPTPDTWRFVLDLDDLELQSEEVTVGEAMAYRFSGTRVGERETFPDVFDGVGDPGEEVFEVYDVFIDVATYQVVRIAKAIEVEPVNYTATWDFSEHNQPVNIELPDEADIQQ
ncbi:MAG: hypothetical protein WD848_04270 [Dehalococcoidia bacterium]